MIELKLAVFIGALAVSALVGVLVTVCINIFVNYRRERKEREEKHMQDIEKRILFLELEKMDKEAKDKEAK